LHIYCGVEVTADSAEEAAAKKAITRKHLMQEMVQKESSYVAKLKFVAGVSNWL
jgi:hypothetical protein